MQKVDKRRFLLYHIVIAECGSAIKFYNYMEGFIMDSNDKLFGILSYLGFLVLIPLFAGKTDFTRYHANQGLVLFILELILGVIITVCSIVLCLIPWIGPIIAGVLGGLLGLIPLVFAILGIINVANEKMAPLPIIGNIKILK